MNKQKVLITGGSGFLGAVLVDRLISDGVYDIRILGRDEGKLSAIQRKHPNVEIFSGDISDPVTVYRACQDIDGIYHLAAAKFLDIAERQPYECIMSNVVGSKNLLDATMRLPIKWITGISTDKAAQVSGVYGATKFLMEKMFNDYERFNGDKCTYRVVRYGNVLYSTGSVLVKWRNIIDGINDGKYADGSKPFIITDPNATRYFWSVDQAVNLIFECEVIAEDSTPYIPTMKSMRVGDLFEAVVKKYCKVDYDVVKEKYLNVIGLQVGENMHEKLDNSGHTSEDCDKYSIDEISQLI